MTGDAGYSIINHIISEGRVPSTIFCINDPIAMGAMQALLDEIGRASCRERVLESV